MHRKRKLSIQYVSSNFNGQLSLVGLLEIFPGKKAPMSWQMIGICAIVQPVQLTIENL